jgi:hypothetical protein
MESRQLGYLVIETPSFASPPRGGFALNDQLGETGFGVWGAPL